MEKLLVVEAEKPLCMQLESQLCLEYEVVAGTERAVAMDLFLQHAPKVVLLGLGFAMDAAENPDEVRLLEWMLKVRQSAKVVLLVLPEQREEAHLALQLGAYDFHWKPVRMAELQVTIRRAFHLNEIEEQHQALKKTLERTTAGIEGLAGQCMALRQLFVPRKSAPLPETDLCYRARLVGVASEGGGSSWESEGADGAPRLVGQMTLREARDKVEKLMVEEAVGNSGGNMTRASELLGVSRPALYDLMKKYGLGKKGQTPVRY
ncbi:transcriptional regulator [Geoanaerobacter pelophilus]|uniref:Transcriptional regulator n=1 Tax=Geoanaerobacter pelophilus TaxID=60036 RepID=A0ABQ0MHF3_9BACT|nr:helix-turn-helix domain-containing protein [Geoanaerobacter pelophilus]GAW65581.1 transcriptional regulator [Geoanaerobacter pelophilus]